MPVSRKSVEILIKIRLPKYQMYSKALLVLPLVSNVIFNKKLIMKIS